MQLKKGLGEINPVNSESLSWVAKSNRGIIIERRHTGELSIFCPCCQRKTVTDANQLKRGSIDEDTLYVSCLNSVIGIVVVCKKCGDSLVVTEQDIKGLASNSSNFWI